MWYILKVKAGKEDLVIKNINKSFLGNLEVKDKVFAMHSPKYNATSISRKTSATRQHTTSRQRSFFPGYVLLEAEMSNEVINFFIGVNGVMGFIANKDGTPRLVGPEEADNFINVKSKLDNDGDVLKINYQIGQKVKIISGGFTTFSGIIEDINFEKRTLFVAVTIFSRQMPVELGWDDVIVDDLDNSNN